MLYITLIYSIKHVLPCNMTDTGIKDITPHIVAAVFALLFLIERLYPLRTRTRTFISRLPVNLALTVAVFVMGSYAVTGTSAWLLEWTQVARFGLLGWASVPTWPGFAAGFLLLDMTFYWWHRANHEAPLLWRFHNVHHIDPDLDVTTSFRFHFVEILYSTAFRAAQVLVIGVSPLTFFVYQTVFTCGTALHHSNLRLPVGAERLLNIFIVTPRMHGIHHSAVRAETNSNYSVVFRWWDALFGTLNLAVPQGAVTIGVPAYLGADDNRLWRVIAMPFTVQRAYWTRPDGGESLSRPGPAGASDPDIIQE